jgi:formylglycine-generating enzyme required for sulfatase activity
MHRSIFLAPTLLLTVIALRSPQITDSAELPTAKEFTNSLGMSLVRIEPGEFTMGAGEAPPKSKQEWEARDEDESPAHRVKISRAIYFGAHEVTNSQFEQFLPAHKGLRGKHDSSQRDDEPVTMVTWQQAVDFCRWLAEKEGRPYRMPTEAEWEFACRAGTTSTFHTGEKIDATHANLGFAENGRQRIQVRAVGSYKPNAWGLFDMHGNVAEWCVDWFGPYAAGDAVDPVGRAAGTARVVRGWSWHVPSYQEPSRFTRCANRSGLLPEDANRYTGFRVVLGEMPSTKPLPVAELPLVHRDIQQTPAKLQPVDETKPYFVDFDREEKNPTIPPETWGPIFSQHNHFSTACVCPNGDVLAVWYSCRGESDRQLAQAGSRLRAGSDRWDAASLFFGTPDVNSHAPVLLRDGQRIYHFCTQSFAGWDDATDIVRWSDDSGATWTAPKIMVTRHSERRLSQPCSAIVAADGAIVVACDGDNHRDARLVISRDDGETWTVADGDMRAAADDRYVIHPAIVQRADGAILSFMRGPDPMPMLISADMGQSWEAHDSPLEGINVGQKSAALRLKSGAILLLTSDSKRKRVGGGPMLVLSLDDGKTWSHARHVEAPIGGYMSLAQGDDGKIYLIGSRLRFAACNEAWIRAGKPLPVR